MTPSAEEQLRFLQHLQRLFEDGDFVATYKFALLMALAEIAVEMPLTTESLPIDMFVIGEKFAELYWPQTVPYASGISYSAPGVLSQNQGKQAAIVNELLKLREEGYSSIAEAKRSARNWSAVVRKISGTVSGMPVQYLQNVGGSVVPFLYAYPTPKGKLVLLPGVAFMLRTFHPLIQQLARAGWVKHVRENRRNATIIGQADEIERFMFGAPRGALVEMGRFLKGLQSGRCFYCGDAIRTAGDVDHFIPWSKYPRDLAHNFVLAHPECNRRKSDMLAAEQHLARWVERNDRYRDEISGFDAGFVADAGCSIAVASWAYDYGIRAGAYGWVEHQHTEQLRESCLGLLATG